MLSRLRRVFTSLRNKHRAPLHIEFNLSDYCNLNCKGCSHYSPIAPAEFYPFDSLEADMRHISSIRGVEKIKEVFIIGGEPLLYPRLVEVISMARRFFPHAKLKLFTNGLLLPKMTDEFWQTCRSTQCIIALTRYPVKFDYDAIERLVGERGVELQVFGDRGMENSFFKMPLDPEKRQNGLVSFLRCFSYGCITIDGGRIFPCSQSACVGHLNRRFGTDFKWEKGDYIDVKDLKSVSQLNRLRRRPVPFCRYCRPLEVVSYGPSRRSSSEWI